MYLKIFVEILEVSWWTHPPFQPIYWKKSEYQVSWSTQWYWVIVMQIMIQGYFKKYSISREWKYFLYIISLYNPLTIVDHNKNHHELILKEILCFIRIFQFPTSWTISLQTSYNWSAVTVIWCQFQFFLYVPSDPVYRIWGILQREINLLFSWSFLPPGSISHFKGREDFKWEEISTVDKCEIRSYVDPTWSRRTTDSYTTESFSRIIRRCNFFSLSIFCLFDF